MSEFLAGAAISEHPVPAHATGEVIAEVLDRVGPEPTIAVLMVSAHHAGALEDIVPAIRSTLAPANLIGTTTSAVIGGNREIENSPAISLWAATWPGEAHTVRLTTETDMVSREPMTLGLDQVFSAAAADGGMAHTLITVADPFSFSVEHLLSDLAGHAGIAGLDGEADLRVDGTVGALYESGPAVIGGLASAASQPGGNVVIENDSLHRDGAAVIVLSGHLPPLAVVAQGCRPVGSPVTVTESERNLLLGLAGKPALQHLTEVIGGLSAEDRALAAKGLHLGWVVNEQKVDFEPGDFCIRGVLGAVKERQAVAVGAVIPTGAAVQFQVRDATTATADLHTLLGRALDTTPRPSAALVFTCNGRGTRLFGEPDHDAGAVYEHLEASAIGGMFCAGEIGPVGGRNFAHGFTASIALFQ